MEPLPAIISRLCTHEDNPHTASLPCAEAMNTSTDLHLLGLVVLHSYCPLIARANALFLGSDALMDERSSL